MQNRTPSPRPQLPDFAPVPRKPRSDGWTPARQKAFIEALSNTGSVRHAARAVNMSPEGAYYLRRQPGAEAFAAAWETALDHGVRILYDNVMERAIHGVEIPVYSYGKLVGMRCVHNDRLAQFILSNRLTDKFASGAAVKAAVDRAVAQARVQWEEEKRQEAAQAQEGAMDRARDYLDEIERHLRESEALRGIEPYDEAGESPEIG